MVRACVFEGPERAAVREFPMPKLSEDTAIAKMRLSGVCGTDSSIFRGHLDFIEYPVIPGHENIGEVYEIGSKARREMEIHGGSLSEGDRITWAPGIPCGKCYGCRWLTSNKADYCSNGFYYGQQCCEGEENKPWLFGGWSEYVYLRPGTAVYKLPNSLPDDVAVLVDTFASVRGVESSKSPAPDVKEGFGFMDTVVVQGSGPIGLAAAIKAKVLGAGKIIMVGGPKWKLDLAREFGVDEVIDITEQRKPEDRVEDVTRLTDGIGADLVVECVGNPLVLKEGIKMSRLGGTYFIIGCFANMGPVEIFPHDIVNKDLRIIGQRYASRMQYEKDLRFLTKYQNDIPFKKLITHRFPMNEVEKAMDIQKEFKGMKLTISPS